ncbi:hypothetical protein [Actinomadura sp. 7K507]|uniref:hypothetical protein n=1 Tax=Actinomadura sp. 7K507 TaxID=2530365 RepID=UPI0010511776|nr:hypothetical protein [Actinomadura sp. 7K507]TDC83613.1 hypothetical protein E1285_28490 [Actinomadura sp. 7K507]
MSWIPVVSAVLGAVIGLGSALVGDRIRWRREQGGHWLTLRREVYVGYLNALHEANQTMRAVSLGDFPPETTRDLAARAAFREAGVNQAQEHLVLVASEQVIRAAGETTTALRGLRDRIRGGEDHTAADYQSEFHFFSDRLHELRNAMRRDLGVTALETQIPI